MKKLLYLILLFPVIAFTQSIDDALTTQNNNTIFNTVFSPTRHGNMFESLINSKVNKRTPEFMDSLDITKIIRFYLNGSHPTATTYNVTWPNKSGTVAFLDDIISVDTTAFWKTTGSSYMKTDTVIIATNEVDGIEYVDAVLIEMNKGDGFFNSSKLNIYSFDGTTKIPLARFQISTSELGNPDIGNYILADPINGQHRIVSEGFSIISTWKDSIVFDPAIRTVFNKPAKYSESIDFSAQPNTAMIDKNYLLNQVKTFNSLQVFGNTLDTDNGDIRILTRGSDPLSPLNGSFWYRGAGNLKFYTGTGTKTFAFVEDISSGIGGSVGATANAVPRADGTGGSTLKSSSLVVNDNGFLDVGVGTSGSYYDITAAGTDTNQAIRLVAKGTGGVFLGSSGQNTQFNGPAFFTARMYPTTTLSSTNPTIKPVTSSTPDSDGEYIVFEARDGSSGNSNGGSIIFRGGDGNGTGYDGKVIVDDSLAIGMTGINIVHSGDSVISTTFASGKRVALDGTLPNIVVSGTSATIDATYIGKNVKCTSASETDLTIPSTLQLESVFTVTQRGDGTINLLAGSNVVINGKTSTTGQWDMIWVYLIEKSGGTSYYIGR